MSGATEERSSSARSAALAQLGRIFEQVGSGGAWPGFGCGLGEGEYQALERAVAQAGSRNGWFTEANVRMALRNLSHMLAADALRSWVAAYPAPEPAGREATVGIIMAGNIPLVGLHDLVCVLVSGHRARVKCSADDAGLTPAVLEVLARLDPELGERIQLVPGTLGPVDAVIATGSNNTARYFEHYFAGVPRIVRRNRTSAAVLDGTESEEELTALGEDLFRFFGLGCRNVSKVYVPQAFDLDRLFRAIFPWQHLAQHAKWMNNYDYHKAIWLLDRVPLLENGFVLLKEDEGLHSPLGSIYYERYTDRAGVEAALAAQTTQLQCVVGHGHLPFGRTQCPGLADYADGVDTMRFLAELS